MNRRVITNKYKDDITDVKIGIALPFNGKGVFKSTSTTGEQLRYNLINLLMTNKGERLFDPDFGCDLNKLIFEPDQDSSVVEKYIIPQVEKYLNAIEITNIDIETGYSDFSMLIKITYKVKKTSTNDTLEIAI